jgi:hypothetical protein
MLPLRPSSALLQGCFPSPPWYVFVCSVTIIVLTTKIWDETPEILDREPSVDHSVDVTRDMIEFDGILVDTAFVGSQLLGHTDIGDGLSLQP